MKRLLVFLRSVIPADPFQLLFLAGIVCLVIARGLRWWPVEINLLPGEPTDSFVRQVQILRPFFVFPIIFAGAAGYFICFWPGAHSVRRILALVFLPTLASLGLLFSLFVHLNEPYSSVLESTGSAVSHRINGAQGMLWNLPQAFQFSLIGLVLIAIFTSRLAFGIAALPLALPERHCLQSEDFGSWRRLQMLLWFLVSFTFFVPSLLSFVTIAIPFLRISRLPSYVQSAWFWRASPIAEVVIAVGITLCIMGKEGRQTVRSSIRLPTLSWSLLALAFPACIDLLISTGQYAVDRAHWAAHDFGRLGPPQFGSFMCVTLSFVLAWLTLRSGSVVPAAIAHTVYNILIFSAFGLPFAGKSTLRIALWAVLAYLLFRYRPAPEQPNTEPVNLAATSECKTL